MDTENIFSVFKYEHPSVIYNLEETRLNRLHVQLKEVSGIYIIRNIINNKLYIGSTKDFMRRCSEHLHLLETGKHHSTKLLNSVNKNGLSLFEIRFYPINKDRKYLFDLEEFLISKYDTFKNGYNMSPNSKTMIGWTDELRDLISTRYKNINASRDYNNEEFRKKIGIIKSILNSGEGNPLAKLTKENVLFIRLNASVYTCKEFCEMFNVNKTAIRNIIHLRTWNYNDCIPKNYIPPKELKSNKKVNKEIILFIRKHIDEYTTKEFCDKFNLEKNQVNNIKSYRTYKSNEYIP